MDVITPEAELRLKARAEALYLEDRQQLYARTDRMFAVLLLAQWAFAIVLALWVAPYTWAGRVRSVGVHLPAAVLLGGLINALPLVLVWLQAGARLNRYVIAVAQVLWSALLIHLTGGRIETHFHVFGSLAFLAFYRDWRVLVPATLVVAADHAVRGLLWPESVYGTSAVEAWRFLEHAGWVVFEDVVLVLSCITSTREMRATAARQAEVESEQERSGALGKALKELKDSQEALVRLGKLAAVGELAASVAHELRNPMAAVTNAHTYVVERLSEPEFEAALKAGRVQHFLGVADREIKACNRIVSDLLDFARGRPPEPEPCALGELVAEAVSLVPPRPGVTITTAVPADLPPLLLDREQFRKVLINLVQNAAEAYGDKPGQVRVRAEGGGSAPLRLSVEDDGPGIAPEVLDKIFQPLFTTKTKGTGLGLAIASGVVSRHQGTLRAESELGRGTRFIVELPPASPASAAHAA